ncbi:MAG: tRNA(Ile)-lysidine synthase [Eubacteriales bacterium]|nr:tRNA(Ile)-lysidine synthase [Eubacteriales bacterium]MDN5363603.1 tRNA(Ile)-lysidine synthase [Eubacteriales bacterium]
MREKVLQYIKKHSMVRPGEKVLVAVSGGPDSMALLHLLREGQGELGVYLHVAHLNHMLRGEEAEEDVAFVVQICREWEIPCTVAARDVAAYRREHPHLSLQAAAREVRYRFLREVAAQVGAVRIATAHHRGDQLETVLASFLRGAGLEGLKGIEPVREGLFIRPLLAVGRREIEEYVHRHGIPFRIDSSNLSDKYLRNRLRHRLIPLLLEYNPALEETVARMADILREENDYLNAQARAWLEEHARKEGLPLELFNTLPAALQRRVLRCWYWQLAGEEGKGRVLSAALVERVRELALGGENGREVLLPGGVVCRRAYHFLQGEKGEKEIPPFSYPLHPGVTEIPEAGVRVVVQVVEEKSFAPLPEEGWTLLDADRIPAGAELRNRRQGDLFYPAGAPGQKKLKEFLIDAKIPRKERDKLVLVAQGKEILAVVGMRVSEKAKVTAETKRILALKVEKREKGDF